MTSPCGPSGNGFRDEGSGIGQSRRAFACSGSSRHGNGSGPALSCDGDPLIGPGRALDRAGQDQVPQVALKRREVQRAQLAAHPCEGAAKIGRVIDQIGHDTAGRRAIEPALCLGPPAPALAQNGFLGLGRGTIGRIGFGQRELERPLGIALEPGMPDELTGIADRPESLVVKIIRQPVRLERRDQIECAPASWRRRGRG